MIMLDSSDWFSPGGGKVEVVATGLYIDGEFLPDRTQPTTEGQAHE
ncbi:hypothetical protein [uncultured Kocuria sp.]|nr:hypothetical protein [uncultured Kocuria sp.]